MSPSWREQVIIALAPGQVALERYAAGLRPVLKDRKALACAAPATGENWQPATEILHEMLAHPDMRAANASVILSNHFVRYLLLPWNPNLVTLQERTAFARARFMHAFGDVAHDWVLQISPSAPGAPAVASGIPRALLDSVVSLLAGSLLRLRSLQPGLMAVFNKRARLPRGDAWIAIAETGRLLLGAVRNGEWYSLRSRPLRSQAVGLAQIIEQEALLLGTELANCTVFFHQSGDVVIDPAGLKAHPWLSQRALPLRRAA